ncbi:MAG: ClpXP protease specificity-enhancing factor SspB [Alphaproteobacteria bacterium]|nr:ClpXP protease specificity-enhancing factor SspB [Alphaproteobacteria bacterium]
MLKKVAISGLTSDHHFYIGFSTTHAGVQLPSYLREEYPEDMTIVLQHEFWDLAVDEHGFSVTLSFDDMDENIYVPFDALISFVDPSVTFGLQFAPVYAAQDKVRDHAAGSHHDSTTQDNASNVVTLDFTRKR